MADKGKINWDNFNFLENLLIHSVLGEREVPPESGVKFRVGKEDKEGEICLIFHIDRENDPIILEKIPRPDYLVFYVKGDFCIFTIIEMKGKAEKNLQHGVEQITTFRDFLRKQIKQHLPSVFKFKMQGILLSPFHSDIPRKEIVKEHKNGFTILPIQFDKKAELFDYVSKLNDLAEIYKHSENRDSEFNFIEDKMAKKVLIKRKNDNFLAENFRQSKDREGIYLNYNFDKKDDYLAVCGDSSKLILAIKEKANENEESLKSSFYSIGISISKSLRIEKIQD